jgi:hypothetical protein
MVTFRAYGIGNRNPTMARQLAQEPPGDPRESAQLIESRTPKFEIHPGTLQQPHRTSGDDCSILRRRISENSYWSGKLFHTLATDPEDPAWLQITNHY